MSMDVWIWRLRKPAGQIGRVPGRTAVTLALTWSCRRERVSRPYAMVASRNVLMAKDDGSMG